MEYRRKPNFLRENRHLSHEIDKIWMNLAVIYKLLKIQRTVLKRCKSGNLLAKERCIW